MRLHSKLVRYEFPMQCMVGVLVLVSLSAEAQQTDSVESQDSAPLFASHLPLQVTIEAPLTTLMKDRPDEEYLDGTFTFVGNDGMDQTLDLKIRTRGNYRREEKHCDFAPIRLNFRKKQVVDTVFAGQDKLKLVTHCQNNISRYEQLVLREYLVYRIFQLMTEKSYGVRLMQINYVDTEGRDPMTKLGFVIEDDDHVAKRVGMKSLGIPDITYEDLDHGQQNLVNVFQFLIGNTEFSLIKGEPGKNCCHNADLMSATEGAPYTPLPYDFDFAGFVNAPYAQPNPRYDIEDVRIRLYKGLCANNELLTDTVQQFHDKKDAIYAIINELDLLTSRTRRSVVSYVNGFYNRISTPKKVNSEFIMMCNQNL